MTAERQDEHRRPSPSLTGSRRQSLLDLLPPDAVIVVDEAVDLTEVRRIWDEAAHHLEIARRRGEDVLGRETVFVAPDEWAARWQQFGRIELSRSPTR